MRAAVQHGNPDIAKLVLRYGANPSTRSANGFQLLHQVAFRGRIEVAKVLMECPGVNVNAQCKVGNTPLLHSIPQRQTAIASFLLASEADTSVRNQKGMSALHSAALPGLADFIKPIMNNGTDIPTTTASGETVLECANLGGSYEAFWQFWITVRASTSEEVAAGQTVCGWQYLLDVHLFSSICLNAERTSRGLIATESSRFTG